MSTDKIIGYSLLIIGILIILGSTWSVFSVFSGESTPPQLFSFTTEGIVIPSPQNGFDLNSLDQLGLLGDLPAGTTTTQEAEPISFKLIPDSVLNQLLNMMVYLLLMMFVSSTGTKLASLGIKLSKDLVLKTSVKETKAV